LMILMVYLLYVVSKSKLYMFLEKENRKIDDIL
jgi:hypothetical protein